MSSNRWRARWIWPAASVGFLTAPREVVGLRTTVTVDGPTDVPVRLAVYGRYVLLVNGVEVARGPLRGNPRRQPAETLTLSLVPGENEVGVLCTRYSGPNAWWMPAPYGTDLIEGSFVLESTDSDLITTSSAWTGAVLDGWGASAATSGISGRGLELIDLRSLPDVWSEASWEPVIERRAMASGESGRKEPSSYPGAQLGSRPISWPTPHTIELTRVGDTYLADRVVAGPLRITVSGPIGATVTLRTAEMLDGAGAPAPGEHDAGIAITLDGTTRTVDTLDVYGLRGLVVDSEGGGVVESAAVRELHHDVTGGHFFECSDELLNRVWAVGRRTVSLCSFDAYLDCPTREQRAWTGDSVVHQMVDLTTNDDWSLARWNPVMVASPRADGMLPMAAAGEVEALDFTMIPDWALHWVHSVWNLYRYVGDREAIGAIMHVVEGVVRWFERFVDEHGTPSDVIGWVIIDWAAVYTDGVCAALCGLWGRALLEFAEMAEWLGDGGRASWARAAHGRLVAGIERLWDPARGRYVDSYVEGAQRPMASQHAQVAALVGGLVPADRVAALVEVMTDRSHLIHAAHSQAGPVLPGSEAAVGGGVIRTGHPEPWWNVQLEMVQAQPFFRYVLHDAVVQAGRGDLLVGLLRDWQWALDRCDSSMTETWYGGTVSHGWSSTPTRDLAQRVLGVTPAEPGFAVAALDPQLGELSFARGSLPTPYGAITVSVTPEQIEITSPVPIEHAGARYEAGAHVISR